MKSHSTESSRSALWKTEYAFESHWLNLPDGRLHYLDEGSRDGDTLLFVHGNPTWSFHWRRLIAALSPTHRCVAIDHLGCGLSDKPQRSYRLADRIRHLGRLVDELDLRRVTLVAQDWGGAIGLGAMLDRQERLHRILLYNTGAWPPDSIPARINVCKTPYLGRLALQGFNLFSLTALRMTMSRRKLDAVAEAGYLAPYNNWMNRRAVYEFVADIPRTPDHPTWRTLKSIDERLPQLARLPIRLVWGMQDWCFTPACLDRFQRYWPDAEAFRLEDVGHWAPEDAPEEALQLLAEFVGGAAAGGDAAAHTTRVREGV